MSGGTRILFKNTYYITAEGWKIGFLYIDGDRIKEDGQEPDPIHELSELQYDAEWKGVAIHGLSAIVDTYEYISRGGQVDFSVFSKHELKALAELGLSVALSHGISLPVVISTHYDVVVNVLKENNLPGVIIWDQEPITVGNVIYLQLKNGAVFSERGLLGDAKALICRPSSINEKCAFLDLRGTLDPRSAIHMAFQHLSTERLYNLLTEPYRRLGLDNGYAERNNLSDIVYYRTLNPDTLYPMRNPGDAWTIFSRLPQPEAVVVRGEVIYEKGEHLVYTFTRRKYGFLFE